jgi:uncharacterized membrane protein YbhN (UPF0104 family)
MRSQDWRRLAPGLIISVLSLAVLLYFVNLRDFFRALQMADYRFVLGSIGCSILWMLVRAKAWRTLLQEKATYNQVFFAMSEGYLLNNILPFRLGEVGRCFLMGKKANLGFWQVLSSIMIERALDMTLAVALLLSTLPLVVGANWARQASILVGGIVLLGLGVLYFLARYREWALALFNRIGERWTILIRLGGKMVPAFLTGLAVLTDAGRFLRAVFWMVLNWLLAIAQYALVGGIWIGGAGAGDRCAFVAGLGRCVGGQFGGRPLFVRSGPLRVAGFRHHRPYHRLPALRHFGRLWAGPRWRVAG